MKLRDDLNTAEVREALVVLEHCYNHVAPGVLPGLLWPDLQRLFNAIRAPEPCEPPIPWSLMDKAWLFQAMDEDGRWFAYKCRPWQGDRGWFSGAGHYIPCTGSTHHWTETLCERPEEES